MIPRYTRPEMERIWSDHHTLELWLQVEIAVAEARNVLGEVPDWAMPAIQGATFDLDRVRGFEEQTHHDMTAFLRSVHEGLGDAGRYVHAGLTSSDVKDTALSLQMIESLASIQGELERLRSTVGRLALEHRQTVMMGRTHGVHSEPITFGFKLAVWYDELGRAASRFGGLRSEVGVAKLAGAVGTHSNVSPAVESIAAACLGLRPGAAETQVIQRDRHARYVLELAVLASTLDKIATEIRSLQRTEICEVQEPFAESQEGSSAMPHKRNPILCERVTGLARILRGYAAPALENMVLWNERDISNSSAERVMLPDASALVDYMLALTGRVLTGLKVFPDRMKSNLDQSRGQVYSQRVLQGLIESGLSRQQAYRIVQRDALAALDNDMSFYDVLLDDPEVVNHIPPNRLHGLFDPGHFLANVDETFRRVGLL